MSQTFPVQLQIQQKLLTIENSKSKLKFPKLIQRYDLQLRELIVFTVFNHIKKDM